MNVAIHQPQYLPWLPYFLKIEESDVFILLDTVAFQKNGLQNRNQIKSAQGAHWLTVPVSQRLGQKICDVKIDNGQDWRRKHWLTILQNYGKAPAFHMYEKELESVFTREWTDLVDLNLELILMMTRWLDIRVPIVRSSEMKATGVASELVLSLCLEVGGTRYLSGIGGTNYLSPEAFAEAGVEIAYRPPLLPNAYPQRFPKAGFINHLSALDLILNCGREWSSYLPDEVVGR
jgi:WbqC-like protein family